MFRSTRICLALLAAAIVLTACDQPNNRNADNRVRVDAQNPSAGFGAYEVRINAMLTTGLTPEIAQGYGIVRSENQGFVNLVILKKADGSAMGEPVSGTVAVSAHNLTGQLKNISLEEITDGPSIYYIGQIAVDDRETINFDFDVRPAGSDRLLLIRFTHQFYTK
jgi:hypothetical protein